MRCNVGVDPKYLVDQHLIAEYRELPMVVGASRYRNWKLGSSIPKVFNLGIGHLQFFKDKFIYLKRRHEIVKNEMRNRGFYCEHLTMNLDEYPQQFCNDWKPTLEDSIKIRNRIIDRLRSDKHSPEFWRFLRKNLTKFDMDVVIFNLFNSDVFIV